MLLRVRFKIRHGSCNNCISQLRRTPTGSTHHWHVNSLSTAGGRASAIADRLGSGALAPGRQTARFGTRAGALHGGIQGMPAGSAVSSAVSYEGGRRPACTTCRQLLLHSTAQCTQHDSPFLALGVV